MKRLVESLPSISAAAAENLYESTPRKRKFEIDDEEEQEVSDFGRKNFGELASSYLTPYLYSRRFLDK